MPQRPWALVPPATMMLVLLATMGHATGAMATSRGQSCCGRGAPWGIKASQGHGTVVPSFPYPTPGQPQPPQ